VIDHQRLVPGVVGLLAVHDLERPDARIRVARRAFDAVEFEHAWLSSILSVMAI
jgi:hypothetical protein